MIDNDAIVEQLRQAEFVRIVMRLRVPEEGDIMCRYEANTNEV